MVLPNMASAIEIKAVSYDVCGVVQMVSLSYKAKVTFNSFVLFSNSCTEICENGSLTHGPENVKPQVKQTDESGNICFEVPPSEYCLSALAAKPESAPKLLFLPPHVDVLVNSPLLNIEFDQVVFIELERFVQPDPFCICQTQKLVSHAITSNSVMEKLSVLGEVLCKEKCGLSVCVTLVRLGGKSREERKPVYLTDESSAFLFTNVLPGKYRLEVKHTYLGKESGEDKLCWEQHFIDIDVATDDVKGITFVQKCYWPIRLKGERYLLR
ncbi:hypothetical protein RHGRI_000877 [Rhododendron griersonianum]|uniref:Uncharacterized protein n=1 Tax=Rhododendron griersonianum TaxID=479676 RepID=A0AAV6LKF7_9ERIC|nr:hypothetical protein RHGRI_000877 [Rhododendron griersonianum]